MKDETPRRKLIKTSLTAPLVLTAGKAGAVARTSFTACLTRNINERPPWVAVAQPDEALRVSRDVFEVQRVSGGRREALTGRYVVGWDNESVFRLEAEGMAPRLTPVPGMHARSTDYEMRQVGKVELLAYLDDQGTVVGMAPQANGGRWATRACYESIISQRPGTRRWWG